MKIFISSEMKSDDDTKRRKVVIKEIEDMGYHAIGWEKLPAKTLPKDAVDECLRLVREESEMLIAIIDDTVSEIINKEIKEAQKTYGEERILYFFTDDMDKRDNTANVLWQEVTKPYVEGNRTHVVIEFNNNNRLQKEVRRALGHLIDEIFSEVKLNIVYHSFWGNPITIHINGELIGNYHSDEIIPLKLKRGPLHLQVSDKNLGLLASWKGKISGPLHIDLWPNRESAAKIL